MKLKKLVIPIVIGTLLVGCSTEQSTDNKGQTERQEEKAQGGRLNPSICSCTRIMSKLFSWVGLETALPFLISI